MTRRKIPGNARYGAVLPLVILLAVILMVIGAGITGLGMQSRMLAVRTAADVSARCAADSAVSTAIFQMNEKLKVRPWDDSSLPSESDVAMPGCDAAFDYEVFENNNVYSVVGTGRAGNSVRAINATLRLYSPFDFALFAREYLELKSGSEVRWINNQPGDFPLQVGTTSTAAGAVTLKNGAVVGGDVVVGAGGDPETVIDDQGADIEGDVYALFSEPVLPGITVPDTLVAASSGGDIAGSVTISCSGKYSSIELGNSELITVDEPVTLYVTGKMELGQDAEIKIGGPTDTDNDASLTIYLAGNLEGKNASGFNNETQDATNFALFCLDTCETIEFKNSSDFYGAIYAPTASVELKNDADVYGSIVAESVEIKNSATMYYDANLRDRSVNDEAVRFVIDRWSEQ